MTAWFNMNIFPSTPTQMYQPSLSLLQDYLQSNIRPLGAAKIYMEGLTQLLAYGLITGSVSGQLVDEPKLQYQILLDVAKHKCGH